MAGQGSGSGQSRGKLRKYGLPARTQVPPTTSAVSTSTTPIPVTASTSPSHPLHGQEFVMTPNPGYIESRSQPSLLL